MKNTLYTEVEDPNMEIVVDPDRGLVGAVMHRAVHDLRHKRPVLQEAAQDWFAHDGREPFSFLWCCDIMGIPHETFREHLQQKPSSRYLRQVYGLDLETTLERKI